MYTNSSLWCSSLLLFNSYSRSASLLRHHLSHRMGCLTHTRITNNKSECVNVSQVSGPGRRTASVSARVFSTFSLSLFIQNREHTRRHTTESKTGNQKEQPKKDGVYSCTGSHGVSLCHTSQRSARGMHVCTLHARVGKKENKSATRMSQARALVFPVIAFLGAHGIALRYDKRRADEAAQLHLLQASLVDRTLSTEQHSQAGHTSESPPLAGDVIIDVIGLLGLGMRACL